MSQLEDPLCSDVDPFEDHPDTEIDEVLPVIPFKNVTFHVDEEVEELSDIDELGPPPELIVLSPDTDEPDLPESFLELDSTTDVVGETEYPLILEDDEEEETFINYNGEDVFTNSPTDTIEEVWEGEPRLRHN